MTWKKIWYLSAVVGQDWRPKTLRELFVQWQAVCIESWHHTAAIRGSFATSKVKYEDLHPYIEARKTALVIKPQSLFSALDE